jgi:hypothetical protein
MEFALARNRRSVALRDARRPDRVLQFDMAAWEQFVAILRRDHEAANGRPSET